MDLKNISQKLVGSEDERAVSPVIGVILMVAITVILAAVIAAFVLDMGDIGGSAPSANYEWDQSGQQGDTDLEVAMDHTGGESLQGGELELQLTGEDGSIVLEDWGEVTAGDSFVVGYYDSADSPTEGDQITTGDSTDVIGIWYNGDGPSTNPGDGYVLVNGANMDSVEELALVWQSDSGDSQVLSEYEVN